VSSAPTGAGDAPEKWFAREFRMAVVDRKRRHCYHESAFIGQGALRLEARVGDGRAGRREGSCGVAASNKITVMNPMGYPPKVSHKPLAPRVDALDGKTVYLVDCRFDDSDIFLKQMQAWFADHMPSVNTVFKPINSVYTKDDPETWEEIKAKGDAAIIGVGH
jgi:hypothetical protein